MIAFAAALLLQGCAKMSSTELYSADETLNKTGEVTLCVSIEDLNTKATVDDNGHFLFKEGDQVAVALSDGSFIRFDLQGTGDTKRAFFKGSIPSGKTIGDCIVYPAEIASSCVDGRLRVDMPVTLKYGKRFQCPAVGKIGEDYNVKLCQLVSLLQVTVNKFPASITRVEFSDAGGKALSGMFECNINDAVPALAAQTGTGAVGFDLTTTVAKPDFFVPVPAGDYNNLQMTFYDENGVAAGSMPISDFVMSFARASFVKTDVTSSIAVQVKQVIVGDEAFTMKETSKGIWEADVNLPASGTMQFNIDSKLLGFVSYSGAGGLGWCKNQNSALPYYNYTPDHTNFYFVGKAIGETMAIADGGNDFWISLDIPQKGHVVYDSTYGAGGSYYIELVSEANPNVVLDEQFDLFTCGGDVLWCLQGSQYGEDPSTYDGIAAATPKKANWNASGSKNVMFDYPAKVASNVASSDYMKNRGTSDWTFCRCDERPSAIQLSQGSYDAYLVTPKLSKMSGSQDVKITLEISRYSSTSHGNISVMLLGAGSFKSAHASQTAGKDTKGVEVAAVSGDLPASGDTFTISESEYCICAYTDFNTSIYKPRSTFEFVASGVTSDTQIKIFCPSATRCLVFGIKVEKI